jgi:glutaredoxin
VYRITGPDGRVTFSDKPPENARATPAPAVAMPGAGAGPALSFELRTVASRFPVTLYTGNDCGPCGSGRAFLQSRGIPFMERTVASNDDIEALKRISGAARLPFLTIGGQQINGYSEPEWAQYLDAAGYPRASRLPAGYRNPAPAPLVAVQVAPVRPAEPQQPPQAQLPSLTAPPAGIRF